MSSLLPLQRRPPELAATQFAGLVRRAARARPPIVQGQSLGWDAGRDPGRPTLVQAKLRVGAVDDPAEQEADRIADEVVGSTTREDPGGISPDPSVIESEEPCDCVQRKADVGTGGRVGSSDNSLPRPFEGALRVSMGQGGAPLPSDLRRRMEPKFAAELSRVRVHDSPQAADLSQAIGARAFTVKRHIFFDRGEFSPSSRDGQWLLAHELAHVFQQVPGEQQVLRRARSRKRQKTLSLPAESPRREALAIVRGVQQGLTVPSRDPAAVDPKAVAGAVFARLRDRAKTNTGAVLLELLDLLAVHPWVATGVAHAVAEGMDDDDYRELLEDGSGPAAITRMMKLFPLNSSPAFARRMRTFGKFEAGGPEDASIRGNKKTTNLLTDCMNCVLHNVEAVFGESRKNAMQATAGQFAKQAQMGVRLRDYARALTATGEARLIVNATLDKKACENDITFDPENATKKAKDPFTFKPGNDPVYKPDPLDAISKAIRPGEDGLYLFMASVQGHHAISLIAEKVGGKVTVFWNDPSAIKENVKSGQSKLGHLLSPNLLALRVWFNADDEHSRAEKLYLLWRGQMLKSEASKPEDLRSKDLDSSLKTSFDPEDPKHVAIVERQRCGTPGIRIWQLLPKQQ
jgi:hypothetical protein